MKVKRNGKFELADDQGIDFYLLKSKILRSLKQNGNLFLDKHSAEMDVMDIVPTRLILERKNLILTLLSKDTYLRITTNFGMVFRPREPHSISLDGKKSAKSQDQNDKTICTG